MSDIAMLVAEEYERRAKYCRKRGEEMELLSGVGVLMENFKVSSSLMREKMVEVFDKAAETKHQHAESEQQPAESEHRRMAPNTRSKKPAKSSSKQQSKPRSNQPPKARSKQQSKAQIDAVDKKNSKPSSSKSINNKAKELSKESTHKRKRVQELSDDDFVVSLSIKLPKKGKVQKERDSSIY